MATETLAMSERPIGPEGSSENELASCAAGPVAISCTVVVRNADLGHEAQIIQNCRTVSLSHEAQRLREPGHANDSGDANNCEDTETRLLHGHGRPTGASGHVPRRGGAFSQIRHSIAHAGNVLQQRLGKTS
jgi:hypothetical protein